MMTKAEIEDQLTRYESLTHEERKKLAEALITNEEMREITLRGALANGDMRLATTIIFDGKFEII